MTVSRALKNSPLIREKTRKRIQQIAREMGYRPNPLVSALMSQRVRQHGLRATANLALLDPRSDDPDANLPYFNGCLKRAVDLGYAIETFPYQPGLVSPARLREILLARGIRGIVLGPVPQAGSEVAFDFTGFAAVTIGYSVTSPALPRVANDIQNLVYDALRVIESRGYHRVGLVMSDDANRRMLCLYTGAASSYAKFFAKDLHVEELVLPDESFSRTQRRMIVQWIRDHRLQAVMSSAQYFYRELLREKVRIPQDIAYLHLHHLPGISCMNQLRDHVGTKAVDLVAAMIQRNESFPVEYPQTVLTPALYEEGQTVPMRRA